MRAATPEGTHPLAAGIDTASGRKYAPFRPGTRGRSRNASRGPPAGYARSEKRSRTFATSVARQGKPGGRRSFDLRRDVLSISHSRTTAERQPNGSTRPEDETLPTRYETTRSIQSDDGGARGVSEMHGHCELRHGDSRIVCCPGCGELGDEVRASYLVFSEPESTAFVHWLETVSRNRPHVGRGKCDRSTAGPRGSKEFPRGSPRLGETWAGASSPCRSPARAIVSAPMDTSACPFTQDDGFTASREATRAPRGSVPGGKAP